MEPLQDGTSDNEKTSTPAKSKKTRDENQQTPQSGAGRPKKPKDLEKAAKVYHQTTVFTFQRLTANQEKERQEKKAAKAEKEKRAKDAENKSRTLMASFFSKPKVPAVSSPKVGEPSAGSSRIQNDFERTFKPFVLKKGSVLAPPNWFKATKKRKGKEVASINDSSIILVDSDHETEKDDDIAMLDTQKPSVDISMMSQQGVLINNVFQPHL